MSSSLSKKCVGINPSSQIHYTDHLAVVCHIMQMPLLFIDERDFELGKKYYPDLQAEWEAFQELTPEYLISRYDVLFLSDLWDRQTFHEKYAHLEEKYQKQLRHVHCPHGFSDKGFYLKKAANEDITLIYGQNMLDLFKYYEVYDQLNKFVISGNYRYTYFKEHRAFYDKLIRDEVLSKFDGQRPVILYAPTWLDLDEGTTFFDHADAIIGALPSSYNMIVKLHPRLELDDTVSYYQILGKYEGKSNILFLKEFPLVYPLLAHTDVYLGDTSSVGYDFLAFNRPMFFLNKFKKDPSEDRSALLFKCGTTINPEENAQLYQIIEKQLATDQNQFADIRRQMYEYTFGVERSFDEIRSDIIKAYSTN